MWPCVCCHVCLCSLSSLLLVCALPCVSVFIVVFIACGVLPCVLIFIVVSIIRVRVLPGICCLYVCIRHVFLIISMSHNEPVCLVLHCNADTLVHLPLRVCSWACAAIAFLAENYPAGQDILIRAGAMAVPHVCMHASDLKSKSTLVPMCLCFGFPAMLSKPFK